MFSHSPVFLLFILGLTAVSGLVVPAPGPIDHRSDYPSPTSKPWVPGTLPGLPTGFVPTPVYHSTGTVPHSSIPTHAHTHNSFHKSIRHTPLPYPTAYPPAFPTGFPALPPYPYKQISKSSTTNTVKSTGWRQSHVPVPTGCVDESTRWSGSCGDKTAVVPTGTAAAGYGGGGW